MECADPSTPAKPPVIPPPAPEELARRQGRAIMAGLVLLTLVGLAVVLYLFNPTAHAFYPRCLLYQATGIQCPGCGGLRATHALLHGDIAAAFRFNPLLFVLAPLLLYLAAREVAHYIFKQEWPTPFRKPWTAWALFAVIILYSILRNLPFPPLA
jgi:hypothetical protein